MKGQSSVEILLSLTVIFTIAVLLNGAIIQPQSAQALQLQILLEARTTCETIADNINLVATAGNNFSTAITIPQFLNFVQPYNATIYNSTVFIQWVNTSSINCPVRAKRILLKLTPPKPVKLGYIGRETCMYNAIQRLNPDSYCDYLIAGQSEYSDPTACVNYCYNYTTAQRSLSHQNFTANLSKYDVIFAEDAHFGDGNISLFANYSNNKTIYWFFTEHHQKLGFSGIKFILGAYYNETQNSGNVTVIAQDDLLALPLGQSLAPQERPSMVRSNVTPLATYSTGVPGISAWTWGKGDRYYHFSDFDMISFPQFTNVVVDSVNISLNFLSNFQSTDFQLNKTSYRIYNDRGDVIFE